VTEFQGQIIRSLQSYFCSQINFWQPDFVLIRVSLQGGVGAFPQHTSIFSEKNKQSLLFLDIMYIKNLNIKGSKLLYLLLAARYKVIF
jgi:hypothetical protein